MEVDASDVGVGAVRSQWNPTDQKLHSCAFFSLRLSPAERNNDVGNHELLAVVLALQNWWHWLEGTAQPFVIGTDPKNLVDLRGAKRHNAQQARWALVLGCFNFTLTYRPGSKNTKPGTSRQFALDHSGHEIAPILSPSRIVGATTWQVE